MPPIRKGDLLAVSQPFIWALLSEERLHRCENCFQLLNGDNSLQCSEKCGYVAYCSIECRDESAALGFHLVECHITRHRPLRNLSRLIARVLVRLFYSAEGNAQNEEESPKTDSSPAEWIRGHKRDWNCLMDHYDDIIHDPSVMHTFSYIYEELELLFDGSVLDGRSLCQLIQIEDLIRVYGKILVNSFAVQESGPAESGGGSLRQIGRAVYLGPSIFDHSCTPDVLFTFTGTRLHLIALRDLPTDSLRSIYISYIDEFESVQERRRQLKAGFYFDCGCSKCTADLQLSIAHASNPTAHAQTLSTTENPKLRQLNDAIEDLYCSSKMDFRYGQLAQRKLSCLPSISKLLPNLSLPPISPEEIQHRTQILNLIVDLNLEPELTRLQSIQAIRCADFLACHRGNARLLEQIAAIYRQFYGDSHPRLLHKLYHFLGVLLEKMATIYQQRNRRNLENPQIDAKTSAMYRQLEETSLELCLRVCGKLYRQAKGIQAFIDDRTLHCVAENILPNSYTGICPEFVTKLGKQQQIPYSGRTASYRDLLDSQSRLEGNSQADLQTNSDQNVGESSADTRKR